MKIYESAEDYLETILVIKNRQGYVRSIDVVHELNVTKPSVSVAMKKLRENGYISMDMDGHIALLEKGTEVADRIYERHQVLTALLVRLGVTPEVAASDACKIEHHLSDETFEKLRAYASEG